MGHCRGFSAKPRHSWLLPDQIGGELGKSRRRTPASPGRRSRPPMAA